VSRFIFNIQNSKGTRENKNGVILKRILRLLNCRDDGDGAR
jgi:hypothetical protein